MNIPAWATHLITFQGGKGKRVTVAIKEGGYQYLDNDDGNKEDYYDHIWGLKDWKHALRDHSYKAVIEDLSYSIENE